MTRLLQIYAFSVLAFLSSLALSIEPHDNYYADDLLDAVDQAREQPHHYDYSNHYRYKRTTAQSIELNRLDLNELEDTHLTIEQNPNGSGVENILASSLEPSSVQEQTSQAQPPTTSSMNDHNTGLDATSLPLGSHYQNTRGSYTTTDIIQSGSMISTPRP